MHLRLVLDLISHHPTVSEFGCLLSLRIAYLSMYLSIYVIPPAKISWGSTEGMCNMSEVTHVLTRNSAYEIDEDAQCITRRPIMGDGYPGDNKPVRAVNLSLCLGQSMTYKGMIDGRMGEITTSTVISIMRVKTS